MGGGAGADDYYFGMHGVAMGLGGWEGGRGAEGAAGG